MAISGHFATSHGSEEQERTEDAALLFAPLVKAATHFVRNLHKRHNNRQGTLSLGEDLPDTLYCKTFEGIIYEKQLHGFYRMVAGHRY